MESMNKFKVLTIAFICMFVFAIGAMYSNTKDAAGGKAKEKTQATQGQEAAKQPSKYQQTAEYADINRQLDFINQRIDELSGNSAMSGGMICKIIGVRTDDGIDQMGQDEAIEEAKSSGAEIVVSCSL
ncbi:hypothetical protein IJ472_04195 [bacterium]|nr:hypothetical protein [bacterium]